MIIQHFYRIYILTLTYTMYSSNLAHSKRHSTCIFHSYKNLRIWNVHAKVQKRSNWYTQVQVFFMRAMRIGLLWASKLNISTRPMCFGLLTDRPVRPSPNCHP